MRIMLHVCGAILFCAMPYAVSAQEQSRQPLAPVSTSPSHIGVALEGGGALGEAHIGVLKWFEQHHIPIDYLAGTSIGGLVGGLYATGKSADELEEIVKTANWPLLLGGGTPYEDLSFRRKEDARQVPNALVFGLKNGFNLPPGLNTGQQINLLIDRETLAYGSVNSFNQLPIPFRCVATELVSGKAYVFDSGSLSDALRSTISIPGVFAPVHRGDQVFVDGGLVDNLPTDVVKQMGAEVIIAVHLQISKTSAKEIQSAFEVLGRSVELVIAETELRGMAGADLVVRANVEEFSTRDYDKTDKLIKIGYAAAEAKSQILLKYALDDQDWAEYVRRKRARIQRVRGAPQYVKVSGVDQEAAASIEQFLQPVLGKPLDPNQMDSMLTRLTGVGRYDSLTYDLVEENGQEGLEVRVHEKGYAPPFLQPSFIVDGAQPDDVTFTMGARLTFMDIAGYRSEWRTDLQFGETYGIATELYRPIHPLSRWYVLPFLNASQGSFDIYYKNDPRAIYRLDNVLGGADLGYLFNRFNQLQAGYGIGYLNSTLRLGKPEFSSFSGRVGAAQVQYIRDHTNAAVVPTAGHYFQGNFYWYDSNPGATAAFPSLEFLAAYYHPLSEKSSLFLQAKGGTTFGYSNVGAPHFFLGGPGLLSSYGVNELYGNQYFYGRTGYLYRLFTLPPLVGKDVYFSGSAEFGKMYNDPTAPKFSADGAGGIILVTALGPVFIGGSVGDTGHEKWFFQLGRLF
ncbi:MAG TPA: patatin-like phospholipase family protein [Candidatus Acidoferrum sp.]|nr:patatin-like phospholipase family protein [Candidatus Acidoferrum sp.]